MTFSSLLLNQDLLRTITELGYSKPTPIQAQAIPCILSNNDLMARAQTGTGKTAAFALPLLHSLALEQIESNPLSDIKSEVKVLVLTPTRELANQVFTSFETYGKYASTKIAIAYGGVSIKSQVEKLTEGVDILVATPGRLLDHLRNGVISLEKLKTLVFDEADRMLDMGFKDEINQILNFVSNDRQTLLFSATFDDAIFELSKTLLYLPKLIEIDDQNTAAQGVEQIIYNVDADKKRELISYFIGSKNWQQVLIFVRTKKTADMLAKEMCKDGIKSLSIHSDKSQGARERALSDFKDGKCRALIATDVAARGIDIYNLHYVINYELPYVAEDYIHRIGRTARAGKEGIAVSLVSSKEEWLLEAIEKVLETKLLQQWFPGYEPSLDHQQNDNRNASRPKSKNRLRKQALSRKK